MTPPAWMSAVVRDFGRAAGIDSLSLNGRGAAVLKFENGFSLRFEYIGEELAVAMTAPTADIRRLLSFSHPRARYGFRVRTGIVPKTRDAVLAIRLEERNVTLPRLSAAFELLWRLAGEAGGLSWA
ncbi:MAG: hypothetical protein ILO34_07495 [Kiritimatiellae bacterium]|nr:hypothetical protein [Kiritimatiellia bacterium]